MRSQRDGGVSAITKVKVLIPEITLIAQGQGFDVPEASIAACVKGEHDSDVPGKCPVEHVAHSKGLAISRRGRRTRWPDTESEYERSSKYSYRNSVDGLR